MGHNPDLAKLPKRPKRPFPGDWPLLPGDLSVERLESALRRIDETYSQDPEWRGRERDVELWRWWDCVEFAVSVGDPPLRALIAAMWKADSRHQLSAKSKAVVLQYLEGNIRLRTRRGPTGLDMFLRFVVVDRVRRWKRCYDRHKRRTGCSLDCRSMAYEKVASEFGLTADVVHHICYDEPPYQLPLSVTLSYQWLDDEVPHPDAS